MQTLNPTPLEPQTPKTLDPILSGSYTSLPPPRLQLQLFRQDLLSGVFETDSKLYLRKADIMCGLILGTPGSMLAKNNLAK